MPSDPGAPFPGTWFDGKTAASREVEVSVLAQAIVISGVEGSEPRLWTLSGLQAIQPVSAERGARLTHALEPDARLIVKAPAFAALLLARAPHLSQGAATRRSYRVAAACLAGAALVAAAAYAFVTFAPSHVAALLPQSVRASMGEQIERMLVGDRKRCSSAAAEEALGEIDRRLAAAEQSGSHSIRVYDLPMVNAFALPGGHIVVTRRLIEASKEPEWLAGVLAHELGHVANADPETQLVRWLGILSIASFLSGGSNLGEALGGVAGLVVLFRYTRAAEREADAYARALMAKGEVDPRGLADLFDALRKKKEGHNLPGALGRMADMLGTHPGLEERIEAIRSLPAAAYRPVLSDAQWRALKIICD